MRGDREFMEANLGLQCVSTPIRKSLEKSDFLSSLSKCDALLRKDFNSDLSDLNTLDSQIRESLTMLARLPEQAGAMKAIMSPSGKSKGAHLEDIKSFVTPFIAQFGGSLDQTVVALSKKLAAFREKYLRDGAEYKLPLEVRVLDVCPGCGMVYPEWPGEKCRLCGRTMMKNSETRTIHLLDAPMRDYVRRNVWLEDAVAREARKAGFKHVVAGKSFRGRSGVWHEADVVAVRNGRVLACECTITSLDLDKASSLLRVMTELAAHRGLLVTAGDVPKDVEIFARAYDISTVPNVLENPDRLKGALEEIIGDFD